MKPKKEKNKSNHKTNEDLKSSNLSFLFILIPIFILILAYFLFINNNPAIKENTDSNTKKPEKEEEIPIDNSHW